MVVTVSIKTMDSQFSNRIRGFDMEFYKQFWTRYFDFNGRTGRKDYWMTVLVNVAILFTLIFVSAATGSTAITFLYAVLWLAMLVPSISMVVRRLHDTGRSGAWFFICFVPIIGSLILLFFLVTRGQTGENIYGPDPLTQSF